MLQRQITTEQALQACGVSPCFDFNGAIQIFSCWRIWFSRLQSNSLHSHDLWAWPSLPRPAVQFDFYWYTIPRVCGVSWADVIDESPKGALPHFYIMVSEHSQKDHFQPHISPYIQSTIGIFIIKLYPGSLESQSGYSVTVLFCKYLLWWNI